MSLFLQDLCSTKQCGESVLIIYLDEVAHYLCVETQLSQTLLGMIACDRTGEAVEGIEECCFQSAKCSISFRHLFGLGHQTRLSSEETAPSCGGCTAEEIEHSTRDHGQKEQQQHISGSQWRITSVLGFAPQSCSTLQHNTHSKKLIHAV